jgi:flagellar biosynthesis/type III secretory pathway chaperone
MGTMSDFAQILQTQAELAEAIASVVDRQRKAIIAFDAGEVERLTLRQEELLQPFHQLEAERARLGKALAREYGHEGVPTLREIVALLPGEAGETVSEWGNRLRAAVEAIVRVNAQNRVLLQNSARYVRESIRLLTDDYRKQLVDQRM